MEWFQYPLPTYAERILTSFICCGWAYGAIFCQLPLPPLKLSQIWEGFWNYGSLLGCKWHHCTVAEALIQHGMVTISPPNIWEVLDKLHMLWMGMAPYSAYYHYHHLSRPRFGKSSEIMVHCWIPLYSGWGSNPTWNGSNISSQHMRCGWAYGSIIRPYVNNMCRPRIGKSSEIIHCWACK